MDISTASEVIEAHLARAELLSPLAHDLASLEVELHYCEPTADTALFVDVAGPFAVGRLTWWSRGTAHAEAILDSDLSSLLSRHADAPTVVEARELLQLVAQAVRDAR